jgi:hypothetical protein
MNQTETSTTKIAVQPAKNSLSRQQLRRNGLATIDFCLRREYKTMSRSDRRKLTKQFQKMAWSERDLKAIERLKR